MHKYESKKYWKLVKKLEKNDHNTTQYVSPKSISNHYKNLLNAKRALDIPPISTKKGKLDYPITSEELEKAKHVLKRGKANGLDTLCNEMISCFIDVYPHIVLNLFNIIMDKSITIDDWTTGIITSIYKKGSRSDPGNYRGISLLSCLGKLFLLACYTTDY